MFKKIVAFFSAENRTKWGIFWYQKICAVLKFFLALFTDVEWDGDSAKVFGFGILVLGAFGFWYGKYGFEIVMGIGAIGIATTQTTTSTNKITYHGTMNVSQENTVNRNSSIGIIL